MCDIQNLIKELKKACNFVPTYKTSIETKHEYRDSLDLSEMGLAGFLLTRPHILILISISMFRR